MLRNITNMISVNGLKKQFGGQLLFEDLSFSVFGQERIGLVGRNGSGKTTLFNIISGQQSSDAGTILIPKGYKIGTLKQHLSFSKSSIVEECAQALSGEERYDLYRVEKILFGLGFSKEDLDKAPTLFSGGYQIRLNLAKLLLARPNMLLLDEPTNYLDIVSIRWLGQFLKGFVGEIILITHDRGFMDQVCTHTMGLSRKRLRKIKGTTRHYYQQIQEEEEIHEKTRLNQERKKKQLETFVERFRAKASKATQAQSKLKLLNKMDVLEKLSDEKHLGFRFNYQECPGKVLMQINDLSFDYRPSASPALIENLSFSISKKDRIAIIGKNGAGKSTLLNLLSGELTAQQGSIGAHPKVLPGYFGQTNILRLNPNATVVDEIAQANIDLPISRIRGICGSMLFEGDLAEKRIEVLSGGERSRVLLGKIIANQTNLLFLDEPTNHLDMESIEYLLDELEEYQGAVVMVTHSEMILKRLANRLIVFHRGSVIDFQGDYQDFLAKVGWDEEEETASKEVERVDRKELKRQRAELLRLRSKELTPLKLEIEQLEEQISEMEQQLKEHNNLLVEASSKGDAPQIAEFSKAIAQGEKLMEERFDLLEQKSEKYDQLSKHFDSQLKLTE